MNEFGFWSIPIHTQIFGRELLYPEGWRLEVEDFPTKIDFTPYQSSLDRPAMALAWQGKKLGHSKFSPPHTKKGESHGQLTLCHVHNICAKWLDSFAIVSWSVWSLLNRVNSPSTTICRRRQFGSLLPDQMWTKCLSITSKVKYVDPHDQHG